jgi:hypothetical protein
MGPKHLVDILLGSAWAMARHDAERTPKELALGP